MKRQALGVFLLMVASAVTETMGVGMILPLLQLLTGEMAAGGYGGYALDLLDGMPESSRPLILCSVIVFLIVLKNVFFILKQWATAKLTFRLMERWAQRLMRKHLHAKYHYILSQDQGVLLNNLTREPGIASKAVRNLAEFLSKLILAMCLYGLMWIANWKITAFVTVLGGFLLFVTQGMARRYSFNVGRDKLNFSEELLSTGSESMLGIRQLKSFVGEIPYLDRFAKAIHKLANVSIKFHVVGSIPQSVVEIATVAGIAGGLLYLVYFMNVAIVSAIPLIALFAVIAQRFFPATGGLYQSGMRLMTFMPDLLLVHRLYHKDIPQEILGEGILVEDLKGDLEFKDLSFSYSSDQALFKDLNMSFARLKTTAIVGPSGSGKSTIVDLLVGLQNPDHGAIEVNGWNLRKLNLRSWRKSIGYVSQDTFLFNDTVHQNICLGRPAATFKEIRCAAELAHAHQFISKLPHGYDTVVGDRGQNLSGGERQRVAIARALLIDPEVLLFDEATSSVDPESEKLIQDSIERMHGERTVIVITHRIASVQGADLIYVIDDGRIVESGSYKDLISARGKFQEMSMGVVGTA